MNAKNECQLNPFGIFGVLLFLERSHLFESIDLLDLFHRNVEFYVRRPFFSLRHRSLICALTRANARQVWLEQIKIV